jgi:cellulose synthase (UDP-forming)
MASGLWLALAGAVLLVGTRRIRAAQYATSRRNAYRAHVPSTIQIDDFEGELVDISVSGAAVRFRHGTLPQQGLVQVSLPGTRDMKMELVRVNASQPGSELASLRVTDGDWRAIGTISLWLFHTAPGAVPGLAAGVPAIGLVSATRA